jgi:hypothetical protein
MGRYDIMTSATKPFTAPIIESAPTVQIPTQRYHDRPQDSKLGDKVLKMSWPLVFSGSSLQ